MKKIIVAAALVLSGCSSMPERTCTAIYESGGAEYSVYVFGTQQRGEELLLRAGYPLSFHYVSENNFKDHDCGG